LFYLIPSSRKARPRNSIFVYHRIYPEPNNLTCLIMRYYVLHIYIVFCL